MRPSPGVSVWEVDTDFHAGDRVWALHFGMMRFRHPEEELLRGEVGHLKTVPLTGPYSIEFFAKWLEDTGWFMHPLDELIIWRIIRMYREWGRSEAESVVVPLCNNIRATSPEEVDEWYYRYALFHEVGRVDQRDAYYVFRETFEARQKMIDAILCEGYDEAP